jgi:hypothetical protein
MLLKNNGLPCPNPNTQRPVYIRVNERTILVNASAAAASHQRIETAPEYKDKGNLSEFCGTEAMTNREWTKAKSELRYLTARYIDSTTECAMDNFSTPRDKNSVDYVRNLVMDTVY